jgi:hypothetical protein
LIAERFAAARRHDDDGVFPGKDSGDDFALAGAKTIKAEMLAQGNEGIVDRRHVRESICFMITVSSLEFQVASDRQCKYSSVPANNFVSTGTVVLSTGSSLEIFIDPKWDLH